MALWLRVALPVLVVAGLFVARVPFDSRLSWVSTAAIVAFAGPSLIGLERTLGAVRALPLLAALSVFALGIEVLSIRTGFPYGRFVYGQAIGGRLLGLVPWTVPLAWIPLIVGAVARFPGGPASRRIGAAALYLVGVDLLLDPAAVRLGFWKYETGSAYYGVPLQNFAGWLLSGGLGAGALTVALGERRLSGLAAASLLLIVVFWTSVCLFAGLWVPGAVGVVLALDLTRWSVLRSEPPVPGEILRRERLSHGE